MNIMSRLPWVSLLLAACAVLVALSPAVQDNLQYDRAAVVEGEIWRLVTAVVVHWNADHLRWDLLAFVLCGSVGEILHRRGYVFTVITAAVVGGVFVHGFLPECAAYRGISGVNSALLVFVAVGSLARATYSPVNRAARVAAMFALVAFAAKTTLELTTGASVVDAASAGFRSLPSVHVCGAIVGAAVAAGLLRRRPRFQDGQRVRVEGEVRRPHGCAWPCPAPDRSLRR